VNIKKHIFILLFSLLLCNLTAQVKPLNLLTDTTAICAGDSFLIKFSEDQVSKNATYQLNTSYGIIVNTKQFYIKKKGTYSIKIIDGKRTLIDTTFLKVNERPKIRIRDTIICGNPIIISPSNKTYKYTWSTGEISDQIKIEKPGTYWVKSSNKGCSYIDTFKVNSANSVVPNFGKEILVCENETSKILSVKAPSDVKLFWNTGANTPSINATKEGVYWVISTSKTCGIRTDSVTIKYKNCDCDVYIPNSFTPNDDDRNDLFSPVFQCEYNYFSITIFDRWGNTVYTSTNMNAKWDGKFKGNPCPDDVYVYRLEAIQKGNDKKIVRNGHISLFR
jgi:gliding motility-associated-like protein